MSLRFLIASLIASLFIISVPLFAAGSSSVSRKDFPQAELVVISWTGDASDGTVPSRTIGLCGWVQKIVTNPGSTAPTANYDMALGDPSDSSLDVLAGAIANRHTSNTEQVYPAIAGTVGTVSSFHPYLCGTYTWSLSNNSQASATGTVEIYLSKQAN